jgi:hypothetical protein
MTITARYQHRQPSLPRPETPPSSVVPSRRSRRGGGPRHPRAVRMISRGC